MPEQLSLFETLPQDIVPSKIENTPPTNDLRMLGCAVLLCDGPLFIRTLDSIDTILRTLKYPPLSFNAFAPPQPNTLLAAMFGRNATGFPCTFSIRIVEEHTNTQSAPAPTITIDCSSTIPQPHTTGRLSSLSPRSGASGKVSARPRQGHRDRSVAGRAEEWLLCV